MKFDLTKLKRVGPNWREGKNISPEKLMMEFGFRGVRFGEFFSQKEKQKWLHEIYDALADLAKILRMERKWIGGGRLVLSIGEQGKGHWVHYERELKIANVQRSKKAGSFAHEWGHAFDNLLCERLFGMNGYLSNFIAFGMIHDGRHPGVHHAIVRIVDQIYGSSVDVNFRSKFYRDASAMQKKNRAVNRWTESEELFARGFEAFVHDSLLCNEIESPWLVYGTQQMEYLSAGMEYPYPTGMERIILNDLYADLVAHIHKLQSRDKWKMPSPSSEFEMMAEDWI